MTAADEPREPDPTPGGPAGTAVRPPVLQFTDSLGRALDGLATTPTWALSPPQQGEALLALTQAENRLAELRLRVLSAADRNEVGTDTGATSTAAWLAHATATTTQGVLADVHLAERPTLTSRPPGKRWRRG
ncbi:MAG: hypothetical protein ACTHOK_17830 [Nocardioidaceae bacterium]